MSYTNLHNHSQYSILDGLSSVKRIVELSKDFACPAVAITDHGNLHCVPEFFDEAKKVGQKPIIGCEAYIAPDGSSIAKAKSFHVVLLAKNRLGYKNLCKLITLANTAQFPDGENAVYFVFGKPKPRICWDWLAQYHDGLICTSACVSSELSQTAWLLQQAINEVRPDQFDFYWQSYIRVIRKYKALFGEDYYMEVMHDEMGGQIGEVQRVANDFARNVATLEGVKLVGTCDSHYLLPSDKRDHQTLLDLEGNQLFYAPEDTKRMVYKGDFWFYNPDEYVKKFGEDCAKNTVEIANKVEHYSPYENKFILPAVRVGNEGKKTSDPGEAYSELERQALHGMTTKLEYGRILETPDGAYTKRFHYELSVFKKMELAAYPLALKEIIDYARNSDIPVGPGRGSSSGSLLCYLLGITQVDPLQYGLIFERFLNPDRVSMPDIDTDFGVFGRPKVVQFIRDNWGADHTALICTFNTFGLKKGIQDLCRSMEIPYTQSLIISKTILDDDIEADWDSAMNDYPEFKAEIAKLPDQTRTDLERSVKALYGKPSNLGVHAAGVLISSGVISDVAPLAKAKDAVAVQYQFDYCEKFGLLKMDILGNRNLDAISSTCRKVGIQDPTKYASLIPLNDVRAFDLMCSGKMTGMFQIEKSKQFKEVCVKLQPREFYEVVDLVALYRPGPIENGDLDKYVKRKYDPTYALDDTILDPRFRSILKETRYCMIYQEQILEIVRQCAGFSYAKADLLRRAIGKKDKEKMAEQEKPILEGLMGYGKFSEVDAKHIWDMIVVSERYSWNKAHAVAYALITYWTAYLSANYPGEFFSCYCNMDIPQEKQRVYISEAKSRGAKVSVPDINLSDVGFNYANGTIYYGIQSVRGVGENTAMAIVNERNLKGPYLSLEDFRRRVAPKVCNKSIVQSLIAAGAFDSIYRREKRKTIWTRVKDDDFPPAVIFITEETTEAWLAEVEGEALGLSVSVNAFDSFYDEILAEGAITIQEALAGASGRIAGVISTFKKHITKKRQQPMAYCSLMDKNGDIIDMTVFPRAFAQVAGWLKVNKAILVSGNLEDAQGGGAGTANLNADSMVELGKRKPYRVAFFIKNPFHALWFVQQITEQLPGYVEASAHFEDPALHDMVSEGTRFVPVMSEYPNFDRQDFKFVY